MFVYLYVFCLSVYLEEVHLVVGRSESSGVQVARDSRETFGYRLRVAWLKQYILWLQGYILWLQGTFYGYKVHFMAARIHFMAARIHFMAARTHFMTSSINFISQVSCNGVWFAFVLLPSSVCWWISNIGCPAKNLQWSFCPWEL